MDQNHLVGASGGVCHLLPVSQAGISCSVRQDHIRHLRQTGSVLRRTGSQLSPGKSPSGSAGAQSPPIVLVTAALLAHQPPVRLIFYTYPYYYWCTGLITNQLFDFCCEHMPRAYAEAPPAKLYQPKVQGRWTPPTS